MKTSVLIPVYNEISTLPQLFERLAALRFDFEVIAADDGSSDGSYNWLVSAKTRYPFLAAVEKHSENRGKGAAIKTAAKKASGEVVIIQDADLEYDPAVIPQLVRPIIEGKAQVVYGSRLMAGKRKTSSIVYLWGNQFLTWFTNFLCGSAYTDSYTCYKAFERGILRDMDIVSTGFELEAELSVKTAMRGLSFAEIPINYEPRTKAEGKKINWKDAVRGICAIAKFWLKESDKTWLSLLAAAAVIALGLRLVGAFSDLPSAFNCDEPHFINMGVYFGGGNLEPPLFKYPTLWLYSLFASFIALFAGWSGFGLLHSTEDFGKLFVSDPSLFYITARTLAALVSCAALVPVYLAGRYLWGKKAGFAAALLLAVSPYLADAAHYAKWESLVLFLSALAWYFAVKIYKEGKPKDYVLCGLSLGLCVSTHYMSGFFACLLPLAHGARIYEKREKFFPGKLWFGLALIPAGFFLGTPYALLDFPRFKDSLKDILAYAAMRKEDYDLAYKLKTAGYIAKNFFSFAGFPFPAALLMLAGIGMIFAGSPALAILLISPVAVYFYVLLSQPDGGFPRYVFNSYPALALAAGYAIDKLSSKIRKRAAFAVICAAAALPGFLQSAADDRYLILPDTRTISAKWVNENIPEGAILLSDQPSASPYLSVCRGQAQSLYERTSALNHPRVKYYKLLLDSVSGGYWIYRLQRDALALAVFPAHLKWTQESYDLFDPASGVLGLRKLGVEYVIKTSEGVAVESSEMVPDFFSAVAKESELLKSFRPLPGRIKGPEILVYRLKAHGTK